MVLSLKVCIITEQSNDVRYFQNVPEEFACFLRCVKLWFPETEKGQWRIYWYDYEGDKIFIRNHEDYNVLFKTIKRQIKNKICFEKVIPIEEQDKPEKHNLITCDGCGIEPIIGFRYKCLQCKDYDLCMLCEMKKIHPKHIMLRLPFPQIGNVPSFQTDTDDQDKSSSDNSINDSNNLYVKKENNSKNAGQSGDFIDKFSKIPFHEPKN